MEKNPKTIFSRKFSKLRKGMSKGILLILALMCLTVMSTGVAQEERSPSTPFVVFPEPDTKAPLDQATLELIKQLHHARSIGDQEGAKKILDILDPREPIDMDTPPGYEVYPIFGPQEPERNTSGDTSLKWLATDDLYVMLTTSHEKSPTMETLWDPGNSPNMYIAAELWNGTSSPDRIQIKRSSNHGRSWSDFYWWSSAYPLKLPKMKIARPNNLGLVFDQEVTSNNHNIWFARHNGTNPSDSSVVAIDTTANNTYRPAITSDYEDYGSGSYIYIVYYQDEGTYSKIMFSRSTDGGATWSTPAQIAYLVTPDYPHIDIDYEDDTNTLWIAWTFKWSGTTNHDVYVQKSTDYGINWSSGTYVATTSTNETYPSIAASSSTCVHVAYEYDWVTDRDIRYAYTSDQGASWNTNYSLEGALSDNRFPIIRDFEGSANNLYCAYVTFPESVILRETLSTTPTSWSSRLNVKNSSLDVSVDDIVALLPKYDPFGGNDAAIAWPVAFPGYGYDIAMNAEWFDDLPPSPDPMYFSTVPYETSTSAISMIATTATDPTPPIEYYFNYTSSPTGGTGGTDAWWQSSQTYTDTGLQTNHEYGYQVRARDGYGNMTAYSAISYDYTDIETPTGITFGIITPTSIQAKSTNTPSGLTRDSSGLVVYNITNGTNSGWKQNNDYWTSTPLSPNTEYGFRARARNGDANATGYSPIGYRYTLANLPGAAPFSNITATSIRANWTANGNSPLTLYYCENITKGTNSGWTTNTYWDSTGLNPDTPYTFRVRAINGNGILTGWTNLGTATTLKSWQMLSSDNPEYMIELDLDGNGDDEVAADFGALGLWLWNDDVWTSLSTSNPENMIAANTNGGSSEELVVDFGGVGMWLLESGVWTQIGDDAENMIAADTDGDNKDEVIADFGASGLELWDSGVWSVLTYDNPENVMSADINGDGDDEIVADFGSIGIWQWNGTWIWMTGDNPEFMIIADVDGNGDDELIVDFGSVGVWRWDGTWIWMTGDNPEFMIAADVDGNGDDELIVDFGSVGVWRWDGTWSWMTGDNPEFMLAADVDGNGDDELTVDFGSVGLWRWDGTWSWMTGDNPEYMIAADVDGDGAEEVVVDFGALGIWYR